MYKLCANRLKNKVFILCGFLILLSCQSNQNQENMVAKDELPIAAGATQFPVLIKDAQDAITSWTSFVEFENDLKRINQGNIKRFSRETERMASTSDTLIKYIPNELNKHSILSRMRVLNMRIKLLNQSLHQPNAKIETITYHLEESNVAFSNLILQINEMYEKRKVDEITKTEENVESLKAKQTQTNELPL